MSWLSDYWTRGDVFDRLFLIGVASVSVGVIGLIIASAASAEETLPRQTSSEDAAETHEYAPGSTGDLDDLGVGGIVERARKQGEALDLNTRETPDLLWDPRGAAEQNILRNDAARAEIEDLLGLERGSSALPSSSRRQGSSLLVFASLGMPDAALKRLGEDAVDAGASIVLQGFLEDSAIVTAERIHAVFGRETEVGFAVDPTAYRRFNVTAVPTVIALARPLVSCKTRFCAEDETPAHDRIAGNATLEYMLNAIAERGDAGRYAAGEALARLRSVE